ncbi:MAG: YesL family protein [Dorea sp.]|nr:YesL family protein [Dorea sp.]MCI9454859.1 YesL family protein [Dorea sp.]
MKFGFMNYDSKFSRTVNRLTELVLLNFVFILTCIPIFTIGAAVTALYSTTLKMARNQEGYIIRGYFKDFAGNFRQATIFWVIELLLYLQLRVLYIAAVVNGDGMMKAYTIITWTLGILYSIYFLFVFPLIATFQNTFIRIARNAFVMIISHLPWVLASYLIVAVPLAASFGIHTKILQFTMLFWFLVGFSLVLYLSSFCLNRIFSRYMDR